VAKITVVGLGPGNLDHLPVKTLKLLHSAQKIYLRTEKHPLVNELLSQGISFESFDRLYEQGSSFAEVYKNIVNILLEEAEKRDVLYAVPGHPMVAERTVQMLLEAVPDRTQLEIVPAMSCLDALYSVLELDPTEGLLVMDCLELLERGRLKGNTSAPVVLTQLYDRRIASEVKLTLMEYYPDDHPVVVIRAAGVPEREMVKRIPLYELDRQDWIDYLTSLFVPAAELQDKPYDSFQTLIDIMARLRRDDGCPWDREQDFQSLKRYLIEETYEVIDAVEDGDMHKLQEELGDLLLQVVFYSQIAREKGIFDVNDVIGGISEKLVRRHPHVFGKSVEVNSVEDVNVNWEKIKHGEKEDRPRFDIPRQLPALMRAEKVQKKAAEAGFDWPDVTGAWEKIYEELKELEDAVQDKSGSGVASEVGDVLFAVVNTARFLKVDPEEALTGTIDKFIYRFNYIENTARERGITLEEMSLEEMDRLWNEVKELNPQN